MPTTITGNQVGGWPATAFMVGANSLSVTATPFQMGFASQNCAIKAAFPAPYPGYVDSIGGYTFMASGSTSATIKFQIYKMAAGSTTWVAVTNCITAANSPSTTTTYVNYTAGTNDFFFAAGDQLSLWAVATGAINPFSCMIAVGVTMA